MLRLIGPRRAQFLSARVALVLFALSVMPALSGELFVAVFEAEGDVAEKTLPGVTVVLERAGATFAPRSLVTDANGAVRFLDLEPGPGYLVRAMLPGFSTPVLRDISVEARGATSVAVALYPELTQRVDIVSRQQVIDLEKGATSDTAISGDFFSDLPVYGREYQKALVVAPGVQDANGDGNPNVHGSRERDFRMTVDGISNVDPLTGQFMSFVNPDAIEEIEIVDAGADASFGGAVGGFGRIITKSGSNEFEGSLNFFYQDSLFDGDGAGGADGVEFRTLQPSAYLSGPIVKDHLWYFVSHELVSKDTPVAVVGAPSFVKQEEALRSLDKLTWQISPRYRAVLQYSTDPLRIEPEGVDSLTPEETGYVFERGGPTWLLRWQDTVSARFFWEAALAHSDIDTLKEPFDPTAINDCVTDPVLQKLTCIDSSSGRRSGPYFQDFEDTRERLSATWDAEYFLADWLGASHRLKFGVRLEDTDYSRDVARTDVMTVTQIDSLVDIQNPFQRVPSAQLSLQPSFPKLAQDSAEGRYWAAYLSDTISLKDNLSITAGVRVSGEQLSATGWKTFDPVAERARYQEAVVECINRGFDPNACAAVNVDLLTAHPLDDPRLYPSCSLAINTNQCDRLSVALDAGREIDLRQRDEFTIENVDVAPRFSVSWDPWNDGKSKVTGSWGRYYGDTFLLPLVMEAGPDTTLQTRLLDQFGNPFGAENNVFSAFSIRTVDRNLETQYSDEWTIGFEREIAPETSIAVRVVDRKYENQLQDTDINHAPVLFDELSADELDDFPLGCRREGAFADCSGRLAFVPVQIGPIVRNLVVDVPDGLADLEVITPMFNAIYQIGNYNRTTYRAYILELTRRFYQNWEMTASYTWSETFGQAEDFDLVLGDDRTNTDDEEGLLATDQTHVVKLAGRLFVPKWGGFRVGSQITYETGLPYSIFFQTPVIDFPTDLSGGTGPRRTVRYSTVRTIFPTGSRNDQRNKHVWTIDVNVQKEIPIRDTRLSIQLDVFNLLNDDVLEVSSVFQSQSPIEPSLNTKPAATRRFGRQFQLALKFNF
ncbi:MAG: TonB-dependent receptor [Acidobacteria bacterium]|nr:TonB-dependent receptor [Acidobacteriota bacterium]